MRKLVVSEFLTIDGVMQGPSSPNEDREDGFDRGGWQPSFAFDPAQMRAIGEAIAEGDAFLFGRKTYEIMAAHWPNQPDTDMFAAVLNPRQKYVVSRSLSEPFAWQPTTIINTDVPGHVARLKDQPGKAIAVLGSGELVQTLLRHDLVDELTLMVHPIVLGSGKRLFRDKLTPKRFELANSIIGANGVAMLTYRPTRPTDEGQTGR